MKILNFFEILFYNIIKCLYITLETKFHPSRSIIEDFEIFRGGEDPLFENFEILFENINKGIHITLKTKFRASRSNIEDFEFFRGGDPHFENIEKLY